MRRGGWRSLVLVVLLASLGGACAADTDGGGDPTDAPDDDATPSLSIGDVPSSVDGNVVTIPVDVTGVEIVKADGDTSGDTGHLHVFVDGDPVDEGEVIPRERAIVHSADNPIKVWGLEPGEHEFTVVVGDGAHTRIHEDLEDSVTVDVRGPSVQGSAPATVEEGDDVTVELTAEGVEIVPADGESTDETGHFHVLVDPASPPEAGKIVPQPDDEGTIFHTAEDSVVLKNLEKGEHVIWVVLGNGLHQAVDPPVMDRITVTVQ